MSTTEHHAQTPMPAQTLPGAHIADPGPLGLAAFALTTFVLSFVNAGWSDRSSRRLRAGAGLRRHRPSSLAGMWEFAKGNTFGATAFCSYGAFWVSFWCLTGHTAAERARGRRRHTAIGIYLLAWGIFTAYMTVAATRVSGAVLAVFAAADAHLPAAGLGRVRRPRPASPRSAATSGSLTAAAAWYASFAGVTAFTFERQVAAGRPARVATQLRPSQPARPSNRAPRVDRTVPAARDAERRQRVVSDETLSNLLHEDRRFEPPADLAADANVKADAYAEAERRPARLLGEGRRAADAGTRSGTRSWTGTTPPFAKWFVGGKLNAAYNCVDRHVEAGHGDQVALPLGGRARGDTRDDHLRRAQGRGLPGRQRADRAGRRRPATGSRSTCR